MIHGGKRSRTIEANTIFSFPQASQQINAQLNCIQCQHLWEVFLQTGTDETMSGCQRTVIDQHSRHIIVIVFKAKDYLLPLRFIEVEFIFVELRSY